LIAGFLFIFNLFAPNNDKTQHVDGGAGVPMASFYPETGKSGSRTKKGLEAVGGAAEWRRKATGWGTTDGKEGSRERRRQTEAGSGRLSLSSALELGTAAKESAEEKEKRERSCHADGCAARCWRKLSNMSLAAVARAGVSDKATAKADAAAEGSRLQALLRWVPDGGQQGGWFFETATCLWQRWQRCFQNGGVGSFGSIGSGGFGVGGVRFSVGGVSNVGSVGGSGFGVGRIGSSIGGVSSIGSVGSVGSIGSIGGISSIGSIGSIGSVGICSVASVGSIGKLGAGNCKDKEAERVGTSKKLDGHEGAKQPRQSSNGGMSGVGSWKRKIHTNPIQSKQTKLARESKLQALRSPAA
jgi:hypothetical protein